MPESTPARHEGLVVGPAVVDGLLLTVLLRAEWTWIDAQLASFLAGVLVFFVLEAFARRGVAGPVPRPTRLADTLVFVLVLALRGGLLATCVRLGLGAAPWLVAAALLTWPCAALGRRGLVETWAGRETGGDASVVRLAITFTGISLLLRMTYLFPIELMHEEAYYWLFAKHLDYGYLDHPPFVAALIWAGTQVAGDTELGVRLLAPLFWLGGATFVFALTRRIYDRVTAWVAVALFASLPFFFFAGMLAFPDTPLIFCWAGCTYFLYRMLVEDAPRAWLGVGLFVGLGLLAKYTMGLLALAALLFVLAHPRSRRHLARWQTYAAILLALLVFSPVLLWNAQHEWMSFAFQTTGRAASRFHFMLPVLILFAAALLTPIGLSGAWKAFKAWWRGRSASATEQEAPLYRALQLTVWLVLVPLSVFVLASFFRNTKFNWTAPIWIPLLPFIAAALLRPASAPDPAPARRIEKHAARFAIGMLVVFALSLYHLGLGLPGLPYVKRVGDSGWRDFGAHLEAEANARRRADSSRPLVVGMDTDQVPSLIAFYRCLAAGPKDGDRAVAETVGGHFFGRHSGMFGLWFPLRPGPIVQAELLLVSHKAPRLDEFAVTSRIERADPIVEVPLEKNGRFAGAYYTRWVYGYRAP